MIDPMGSRLDPSSLQRSAIVDFTGRLPDIDGFLAEKELLILDRDSKYSSAFRDLLKDAGVQIVRLPPRSPNLNAHAERFVRSIKDECLSRVIFFGERSLRKATREFAAHYHRERNHQGLSNRLIEPDNRRGSTFGAIVPAPTINTSPADDRAAYGILKRFTRIPGSKRPRLNLASVCSHFS